MERVGDNPLLLEAVSVVEGNNKKATDIVLRNEAASSFLKVDKSNDIIANKAVVFLID